jgi:hypothetical protein
MSDQNMKECIQTCWECRDTCQDTLYNHILERGGDHINVRNMKFLTDCIQICQVAADFMRRNSELHMETCEICAIICDTCADSCEQMGKAHTTIKKCAEVCRRCAESCRQMSKMRKAA